MESLDLYFLSPCKMPGLIKSLAGTVYELELGS